MLLAKELISKYNGVVFTPQNEDQMNWTMQVLPKVKDIEPNKRIIVVLEDIDSFVGKDRSYSETMLLNFLDGVSSCDGIVTIATTNYPEKLQERITNRPSRFDRRYEVGKPNAETRRFYIEQKLQKDDLKTIDISEIIDKTEGFTIDHLKEYLLSVFVLGYSHEDAMDEVTEILGTRVLKNTKLIDETVGFKPTS
jgi:SpoVK/Ycf46/Vps4 family AAA+-type ATPase